MKRNEYYNTKQKDLIIDVIKSYTNRFTIKNIYNKLNGSVGLTTIYRQVDKLVCDGVIKKYIENDNITYYQYLEQCEECNHFYLKCDMCGKMSHIDCDCIGHLSDHILNEHKFITDKKNIIINGRCNKCNNVRK